ncbi:molybdopterin-binding protein [Gimibacter soli]|uniref:Molybdenum cofactor guanylyltransferase n=1 Tax=Gimibacter soli TaxID=3024400 RepID=A0AAF0BGD4_9PROT|nr:gephyrin-like molybdotransferase Glp [Gimibacter soli]WCL53368.1 molybdopterin-binding protein [Gimibacter soli]
MFDLLSNSADVPVVILAGGQSRRMRGPDKAEVRLGRDRMIDLIINRLRPQASRLLVSGPHDYGTGLTVITDMPDMPPGPVGGIHSIAAWLAANAPSVAGFITTPVDGPCVPEDLVCKLSASGDAAFGLDETGDHPTFAYWSVPRLMALRMQAPVSRASSLRALLAAIDATPVAWPGAGQFLNINTPEELAAAQTLHAGNSSSCTRATISYSEALAVLHAKTRPLKPVYASLKTVAGHVLAADVMAEAPAPAFDNAAMDGFALRAADTDLATPATPARLEIIGTSAAGDEGKAEAIGQNQAVAIMTGAPVPLGTTSVIPIEATRTEGSTVLIETPFPSGKNIRRKGTDFNAGDRLVPKGTFVTPSALPALAASGQARFAVYPKPRAFWISSGNELVDDPAEALAPGQIYNSSGPFGEAALHEAGATCTGRITIRDDADTLIAALSSPAARQSDLVISTGAVSAGRFDFVRTALEAIGATIHFHGVRIRPGKPVLFAQLADGRYFAGLPGNPSATTATFRLFVNPLIRALTGLPAERPFKARLTSEANIRPNLTFMMKAHLETSQTGQLEVKALDGQQSYKVANMIDQNAWILHVEGAALPEPGTMVDCLWR